MELHLTGLSKTYPNGVRALDDVSLTIPTGMFGLLGPNGAGKSTLMRTLATLQDADHGSAQLVGVPVDRDAAGRAPGRSQAGPHPHGGSAGVPAGRGAPSTINVLRDKAAVRRVLGYLPQDFGVYPKVSAEDMLDHLARLKGITNKGERADVVASLLRQTNLYDVRKKALGGYSGGMRQRFGIAQALLGRPLLIIVDEPTAGLDPEERTRFHNLLVEIGEEVIVVLSTHIVSDVSDLCPRLAIMNKGRVLVSGTPQELVDSLDARVWSASVARSDVAALREQHAVISTRLYTGKTQVNVIADGSPGSGFEPVEPTLEDAYFAAIGGHLGTNGAAAGQVVSEGAMFASAAS
jgi:ABC-type multidrug transport system ATPase subunit